MAKVRRVAPRIRYNPSKTRCDADTVQAVITHRYEVLHRFAGVLELAVRSSAVSSTIHSMRQDLSALWGRTTVSVEQLAQQLEDWCRRAEESGIAALREFSRTLRSYALRIE